MFRHSAFASLSVVLLIFIPCVYSHGKILVPPGRGSLWRFGHPTPSNWDDDGNFCGGYTALWLLNEGKCGICGDSFSGPKDHEVGGKFYSGIKGATFQQGQTVNVMIQITANHRGTFEFRICNSKGGNKTEVTQECLDENLLTIEDHGKKYNIESTSNTLDLEIKVQLPRDLYCEHCVLQWHWRTSNFWGMCDNETGALGCGPQEVYRNCADIEILKSGKDRNGNGVEVPFDNSLNDAMMNYVKQPWFDAVQAYRQPNYRSPVSEHKYPVTYFYGYPVGLNWQFRSISP